MTIGNDDLIRAFLAEEARRAVAAAPSLDEAVGRLAPQIGGRQSGASQRLIVLLAATLLLVSALATAAVGSGILRLPLVIDDPVDLGIFEPVAGRIVIGDGEGIWGIDPIAPADPATRIQLTSGGGTPLGWSADGTRLLIMRDELLFVLHSDGSETQVSERPMAMRGAAISPDGSRVVFATIDGAGNTGFVFAVDADGGPAEVLLELDGLEGVSFSPDGTRIAYVSGRGDSDHRVSVMDADGTNPREILANEVTLDAGHDHGIAWSPAGDRIALGIEGTIYTFAPDGSGFAVALVGGRLQPFWSPDGSQLETSGPWHPGTVVPIPSPFPTDAPTSVPKLAEEAVAGRIVYSEGRGIWGIDPAAPADPATRVQLSSEAGTPLGWSADGTRLLIMREAGPEGHLFVLHADGSETQVTDRPMANDPATISPDGSRVVFAGYIETPEGECRCALYAVDADGGPAEVLLESQGALWGLTFSPDGTRIAYVQGAGDHSNSVWVMDADGSDAHQVVTNEGDTVAGGHVRGLAWSPTGDQIALGLGGSIYTFAPDGSDFTQIAGGDTTCGPADPCAVKLPRSAESPYWSPDGSQIAYTTGCFGGAGSADRVGCDLAIADADGSNVREFSYGASGPWHPGTLENGAGG